MNISPNLITYLECEKENLVSEFPKNEETTTLLFEKVFDFLSTAFDEMSDNKVYRCFLLFFREIICIAFDKDVSKVYLRQFFKIMNNDIFLIYLSNHAKSREKDIKNIMNRFVHFFITSWQGYDNNKDRILDEIIGLIDYWM